MSSQKVKISFERRLVEGSYTVIDTSEISKINKRLKEEMSVVIRDYEKKETSSFSSASKLVLNS